MSYNYWVLDWNTLFDSHIASEYGHDDINDEIMWQGSSPGNGKSKEDNGYAFMFQIFTNEDNTNTGVYSNLAYSHFVFKWGGYPFHKDDADIANYDHTDYNTASNVIGGKYSIVMATPNKQNFFNFLRDNNAVKDENYGFINHSHGYLPLVRLNSYAFSYDENNNAQLFGDGADARWGFKDLKWYVKTEEVNVPGRDGIKAVESCIMIGNTKIVEWPIDASNYFYINAKLSDAGRMRAGHAYHYNTNRTATYWSNITEQEYNSGISSGGGVVVLTPEEVVSAAETELTAELDVPEVVVTAMKAIVSVVVGNIKKVTITANIKDSILKTSSGVKETKENITKKRKEFLKILFANNAADTKIKMTTADIGLNETLKDALGTKEVKENVTVLKKNVETAIVVSTETSADTGIYAELGNKDDFVKFDVNGNTDVTITKTKDASSNGDLDEWTVNYDNVDYIKRKDEKITINGYTIYIGSVYIDGDSAGIPASGQVFDLKFAIRGFSIFI